MISIIVPIYNAERYLDECLESIRQQTYKDFEVVCVNDGSVDNSERICKDFANKDTRFRLISQVNQGVSAARNTGLDNATGEYICFVDGDDVVDSDYLQTLVDNISDYDLAICDYTRARDDLGTGIGTREYTPHKLIHDIVFEQTKHPNIVCFLYKREIVEEVGIRFTVGCVRNEDYEFYMRYLTACQKQILILGYVGYYYRQNGSSAMSTLNRKSITSIEATKRVATLLETTGYIINKEIVIANGVVSFLYRTAVGDNRELYDYVHSHYDVKAAMKMILAKFPVHKKKLMAAVYLLLGKRLFYSILS